MARVYSAQLTAGLALTGTSITLATVPAGHVWVLRHMTANGAGSSTLPLSGFRISLATGQSIWGLGDFGVMEGVPYDWSGRHVVPSGETLIFSSSDPHGWDLLVSGYDLVTP